MVKKLYVCYNRVKCEILAQKTFLFIRLTPKNNFCIMNVALENNEENFF